MHYLNNFSITKRDNCDELQLEGRRTSRQSFWALITRFLMHHRINFNADGQY